MLPGRTTSLLVMGIVQTQTGVDLDPYIDPANELVTEKCAVVFPGTMEELDRDGYPIYVPANGGFMYSDYRLELIERWLAAHFYCVFDPRPEEQKAGSVGERLQGRVNLGLNSSLYGQQAMRLDTQGALAIMDNAQKHYRKVPAAAVTVNIGVTSLGRRPRRGPVYGGGWGQG